jgi:hypothetical protein
MQAQSAEVADPGRKPRALPNEKKKKEKQNEKTQSQKSENETGNKT